MQAEKIWDVIVIGGGATGLGTAVDAAARGFSVLLLESHDFAKGASSRSTKLIHGGVRYLAQGNIGLVRQALAERAHLSKNAAHLVKPLSFVIPAYRLLDKSLYGTGIKVYDALAGRLNMTKSRSLSRQAVEDYLPTLRTENLQGGIQYYDGQFDDARLAIALMRTIFDLGGHALNYAPVTGFLKDKTSTGKDRVCGVTAHDALMGMNFTFKGKVVINATGVWVDDVRSMDEPQAKPMLTPSQGVHLVIGPHFLPTRHALLIPKTDDGRVLFVIPWMGKTLLGTTDTPRTDTPMEPQAFQEEVDFILMTAGRYLNPAPTPQDVSSIFVGLRPLVKHTTSKSTAQVSREHVIVVSDAGVLTITGGKWTTYRSMARDAIDQAIALANLPWRECRTENLLLHGACLLQPEGDVDFYGTDLSQIMALPGASQQLHAQWDLTEAHVRFFARKELAQTVEDVLARRHRLLFLDAQAAQSLAAPVAHILAEELGHGSEWVANQVTHFNALSRQYMLSGHVSPLA